MKSKDSKFTRYLKYGRMSVQGEKKKHSILIYYDTQEHRFVKFHASAKTSRKMLIYNMIVLGIVLILVCWDELISWVTPYCYPINTKETALMQWLNSFEWKFHWWLGILAGVLAIGWYLLNRHVDPNEFEDPVRLKDVADSNKDYVFMFIVMLLFDCFFIWLIYSDSDYPFPNLGLSDVFTAFLVILFTIYFLCIIVESMIAYCKYLWNVKIRKK